MTEIDRFKFEDEEKDFPIYKDNPPLSRTAWAVLLFVTAVGALFGGGGTIPEAILKCLVLLVPLLYFLKWDYHALFQKPKAKDIGLAIVLFIGYVIYGTLMAMALGQIGIGGASDSSTMQLILAGADYSPSFMSTLMLVFALMTEELIKLIPFLLLLKLFYRSSGNRKASIILSMFIVMLMFAALHADNLNMLIFAIFVQGFGSIFEFIGYIKTKNLIIPYITHLCTDVYVDIYTILATIPL